MPRDLWFDLGIAWFVPSHGWGYQCCCVQMFRLRNSLLWQKYLSNPLNHIHVRQVSLQLNCADNHQIWTSWLTEKRENIFDKYETRPENIDESLQWRHNERKGVSNHWQHDCLFTPLFRRRSNKSSKKHVTGLCKVNSPIPCRKGQWRGKRFPSMTSSRGCNWFRTPIKGCSFHCQSRIECQSQWGRHWFQWIRITLRYKKQPCLSWSHDIFCTKL